MSLPTVVSLWVLRPEEHPEAEARNYPGMLQILQRSCDRLGLRHVVLTDQATSSSAAWPSGVEPVAWPSLPAPLMQVCTEAQARYLELNPETDTLFVGADCIFLADPAKFYPRDPGICVTYRTPKDRHPINTGAQMIRRHALERAAVIYRRIADRCGTVWCDDQRALCAELSPLPPVCGIFKRAGVSVAFLPMKRFNVVPTSVDDPCRGACMLHFRGKRRKQFLFDWTQRHRPEFLEQAR